MNHLSLRFDAFNILLLFFFHCFDFFLLSNFSLTFFICNFDYLLSNEIFQYRWFSSTLTSDHSNLWQINLHMHAQLCECILHLIHNWNKCFHSRIARHFLSSWIYWFRANSLMNTIFFLFFSSLSMNFSYLFLLSATALLLLRPVFIVVALYFFAASFFFFLWTHTISNFFFFAFHFLNLLLFVSYLPQIK